MPKFPVCVVDAFTDKPFAGNPAGVCLLDSYPDDDLLQNIAGEINLSETAFLVKDSDGVYDLRWFTPTVEVDLCGHATLASAHTLWETGAVEKNSKIRFNTRSGELLASLVGNSISLNFPVTPLSETDVPKELIDGLKIKNQIATMMAGADYLLELSTPADVLAVTPDFKILAEVKMRGVIVTAKSDEAGVDFVSRFFAPSAGIDEDPVTGSAHCALAPYWAVKLGKTELHARQISKRGGELDVAINDERVTLTGMAVTVWRGEFLVP